MTSAKKALALGAEAAKRTKGWVRVPPARQSHAAANPKPTPPPSKHPPP